MIRKKKPVEGKVISKSEDKVWKDWYEKLTPKDHDNMLAKLGLDKEDREEFLDELKIESKPKTKGK